MTETIAILFIFFILVALGISFYAKYTTIAFEEQQGELLRQKAIRTTLHALFLPELICSQGTAELEENCVDMLKARHFPEIADDYYFDIFSYATVSLHQLYPEESQLVLYNRTPSDWEQKETTFFVVTLRDELLGARGVPRYGFGYLEVDVYRAVAS